MKNMDGVLIFLDDILCAGRTQEEHNARLDEVLRRLQPQIEA